VITLAILASFGASVRPASASDLIARDATGVRLAVNAQGEALVTYRARGRLWRVLAWGAINALPPTQSSLQVRLQLDYAGGHRKYRRQYWQTFGNACRTYDGPKLAWLVAACKAPDGSYWALQRWQRLLPDFGVKPQKGSWELRLSHWTGEIAVLTIGVDWAYRHFDHLYGQYTYRGLPVYGFTTTSRGSPLDTFGRNIYLDTFNSGYGDGWYRETGFVAHEGTGVFCYGLYPHGKRPSGMGEAYRATVIGPGVTPDVFWTAKAPGPYDREVDAVANGLQRVLFAEDKLCKPN
jgi:hypothetical protein